MKSWKSVLGYVRGDTLQNIQRKTQARLRSAVSVNNPVAAKETMLAWQQARESFGHAKSRPREENYDAFVSAARAHRR